MAVMPVPVTPPLPFPSGRQLGDLAAFDTDLVRALHSYLSRMAQRANASLAADGSIPMTGNLDLGGNDIINVGSLTINGLGNGLVVHTGSGAYVARTVTGTGAEITVVNGSGVAGNPTLSLPAALTFTGKTITGGTYASGAFNGTLGATTPSTIVVSNGSGASPSINSSAGTGLSFTANGMSVSSGGTVHSLFNNTGFNSTRNGAANVSALIRSDNHGSGATIANLQFTGTNSTPAAVAYARLDTVAVSNTAGSHAGRFDFLTAQAGAIASRMTLEAGLRVGSPVGGDKGAGTINVSGDIYKNNVAYTSPDYVFEQAYLGYNDKGYSGTLPLNMLEDYLRANHRLPGITDRPLGLFDRTDTALEKIEELSLYIVELHNRLTALETT